MKGLTLSIIVIILIFLLLKNSPIDPYSGKYYCQTNTSITLELYKDNKFVLVNTFGKTEECFYGKYSIKDNRITLMPNNNYPHLSDSKDITGKVEGTRISFSNFQNKTSLIFDRQ